MSRMSKVVKILTEVLNEVDNTVKYMTVKDVSAKIKEIISIEGIYDPELYLVDVYRTIYQIGMNHKGFYISKDENKTYIVMG